MCVQILTATKPMPFDLLIWVDGTVWPWLVHADRSLFTGQGSLTADGRELVEQALVSLRRQLRSGAGDILSPPALKSAAG